MPFVSVVLPFDIFDDRTSGEKEKGLKTYNPLFHLANGPLPSGLDVLDNLHHSAINFYIVIDLGSLSHLNPKTQGLLLKSYMEQYEGWFDKAGYPDVPIKIKYKDGIDYEYSNRAGS